MAALIVCPSCKKKIAPDARACPKCGHELTDAEREKGVKDAKTSKIGCLGLFAVLVVIGLAVDSCDKKEPQSAGQNAATESVRPVEATPAEIKKDKEFPFTRQAVIKAYDDVVQQVVNMRPLGSAREEKGNSRLLDMYSYTLTPNAGVMLQCNKDGNNPTHVKAIGVDDGTDQTRAFIVLNAMTLMAAVTPGWQGDERGAVAKELGITTAFPAPGKHRALSYGGLNFDFVNNEEYGLTLTISPAIPSTNTAPPAAAK